MEYQSLTTSQKALNLFNAALVTPTYYVYFTSSTIVASAVLFQGFKGTAVSITTVVMGFLVICAGVVLLQLAKSSKDVPDTAVLKGEYDQVRTIAEQEEPEYEPRADTIRGGAAIVRAMSKTRTKRQAEEAQRIHEERMEPIGENETVEWDGLRRRKTTSTASGSIVRRKTVHPPLGMTHFPDDVSETESELHPGFFGRLGRKSTKGRKARSGRSPVPLGSVNVHPDKAEEEGEHVYGLPPGLQRQHDGADEHDDTSYHGASSGPHLQWAGDMTERERDRASSRGSSLAPPRPPPHAIGPASGTAKRQFSFQNVFHRNKSSASNELAQEDLRPKSRGALSFVGKNHTTTEEERLGLVHGDSSKKLPKYDEVPEYDEHGGRRSSDEWQVTSGTASSPEEILGASGDLGQGGRGRRDPYDDYDDDLYDEPLRSPRGSSEDRGGGSRGAAFV